jgi:hypothetical protein
MTLYLQTKINKAKEFMGLPSYSKDLEEFAQIFQDVVDIVWSEDCGEKYVELVRQAPLELPKYEIKYHSDYFNEYSKLGLQSSNKLPT